MIDAGRKSKIIFSRNFPGELVFIHQDTDWWNPTTCSTSCGVYILWSVRSIPTGTAVAIAKEIIRTASANIGSLLRSGLVGVSALVET